MAEQIGWFACKSVGAHIPRFEYKLQQRLQETVLVLNCTEKYSGAKSIGKLPAFEIDRRPVYENDGSPASNTALTISCENANAELLKDLLVDANLDTEEFGTFMQRTTSLSNPKLHATTYQDHLAFTMDNFTVVVEGLHIEVLEERVVTNAASGETRSVREVMLATERNGSRPIWAIEYTTRSAEEGRFHFITNKDGAEGVRSIVRSELLEMARKTVAFASHCNKNVKFSRGIKLAANRLSRNERHENGVRARQGKWKNDDRSQSRQARNRVIVFDAPWELDEDSTLQSTNANQAAHAARHDPTAAQRKNIPNE
jgi:hypothetical protein